MSRAAEGTQSASAKVHGAMADLFGALIRLDTLRHGRNERVLRPTVLGQLAGAERDNSACQAASRAIGAGEAGQVAEDAAHGDGKRTGQPRGTSPQPSSNEGSRTLSDLPALVKSLARLALHQETAILSLKLDVAWVLFLQPQGAHEGMASRDGGHVSPMVETLKAAEEGHPLYAKAVEMKWLHNQQWGYQKCSPALSSLTVHDTRQAINPMKLTTDLETMVPLLARRCFSA